MASTPSSVSALLKPKANLGRNHFPLDHKQVFSIKAGQITPVKCMHFIPDDYFDISTSEFCITFPMNTAPFLRGRKETAFYSVYYSAIWSLYNQYIGQRQDPKTSAFGSTPNLVEPRISKFELYKFCFLQFWALMYYNWFLKAQLKSEHPTYDDATFESNLLIKRNQWLHGSSLSNSAAPLSDGFGLLSEDRLPQFNWSVTSFSLKNSVSYTPEFWFCDVVGQFRCYNNVRKLDMLGYGNLYPWFKECDNAIGAAYDSVSDWSQSTALSSFLTEANRIFKTLSMRLITITCSYDKEDSTTGFPQSSSTIQFEYVNLYPICAYNLIFYHFFRNSFYDLSYDPRNYNLDFVSTRLNDLPNILYINDFPIRFLDIEYHQWKKDTFTSVIPDTQFGAVSSVDFVSSTSPDFGTLNTSVSSFGSQDGNLYYEGNLKSFRVVGGPQLQHTHDVSSSFDVIALSIFPLLNCILPYFHPYFRFFL